MTAHQPTGGRRLGRSVGALLAVAAVLGVTATQAQSDDAGLTIVGVDTLGFPYIDLVVGGLPGPGTSAQSAVSVTQFGQRVPVTSTWLLSEGQPLAVVTDASAASLKQVQGIVGELVQAMPPQVPMALVSPTTDRVSPASVNRDVFMNALQRQAASTARPISAGITAAASAGIQHVFVVTSCASPPPSALPIGVIADVLGVGPGCTDAWRSALSGRAGRYMHAPDTGRALGALDAMVSGWRSSAVVIAQVSTRQPLQVSAGGQQRTVSLGGPTSDSSPASSDKGAIGSRSDRLLLGLGLVLLLGALALVLLWVARRRRAHPRTDLDEFELPPLHEPEPKPKPVRTTVSAPRAAPAVVDLRDPVEEAVKMPLMAVATPSPVRQADHSRPAMVAMRDEHEEPEAMAEERVSDDVQNDAQDQGGDEMPQPAEDQADDRAEAAVDEPAEDQAEDQAQDQVEDKAEEPAEAQLDEPAEVLAEQVQAEEPAEADAPAARAELPPVEFKWTPLQFSELVWRSDADREQPASIDLREPGTVDVREKTARRQKARRKTNR